MTRWILVAAGLLGAAAVALGAFGAHGLVRVLDGAEDAVKRVEWWQTAVLYHLAHSVGLLACAVLPAHRSRTVAAAMFVLGIGLFSGTLYGMSLGAPRSLGAVTPLGGLALIIGWLAMVRLGFATGRDFLPPSRV